MNEHIVQRAIFAQAGTFLGLEEYPGAKHNSVVVEFAHAIGHDYVRDDETPWCASFVGAVLASLGLPHTGKLTARSYEHWGREIPLQNAVPGDIVVLWRKSPDSWEGHVGFFAGMREGVVVIRGGNQGDRVTDAPFPLERVLSVRRLDPVSVDTNRPTLRKGNTTPLDSVRELQMALAELGFFSGEIDGLFGPRTENAVMAFQAHTKEKDPSVVVDGIVGPITWEALLVGDPMPLRDKTEEVLRHEGSRTILDADIAEDSSVKARRYTLGTATVGAVTYVVENMDDVAGKLSQVNGVLATVWSLLVTYWPLVLIAALTYAALNHQYLVEAAQRSIRKWRTQDAQLGKHMGR